MPILLFGMLMASTAVLMIKATVVPAALLAALRMLGAALVLLPLRLREQRTLRLAGTSSPHWWVSIVPGLLLGIHFITWNMGSRISLAGNATLVANLAPVVMPLVAWLVLHETPTKREWAGTLIALIGLGLLAWGDVKFVPEHLLGDVICFGSMLLYVAYIVLARSRAMPGALFSYVVPLYAAGGLLCLGWSMATELPWPTLTGWDGLMVLGLIVGPTVAGHSIFNWAITVMRAQTVSLVNLAQFVVAGVLAFLIFGEVPGPVFPFTAVFVVVGAVVALSGQKSVDGTAR